MNGRLVPALVIGFVTLANVRASGEEDACNDEMVAQLSMAGIAKDLIVEKINQCDPHFAMDTSHLISLKRAGVPDDIVRIMARRQNGERAQVSGAAPYVSPSSDNAGGALLPDEVGLYWIGQGHELYRIEGLAVSNMRTGSTLVSRATMGIKRARVNAQLKGSRADMRIRNHQPEFYLYLPEGASVGDYLLLRLAQREDVRQIEVGEWTIWKYQMGVDHFKEVDFGYRRIKNRLYLLTPKTELPAGEFGFYIASGVELTKASGRIYDFGVD